MRSFKELQKVLINQKENYPTLRVALLGDSATQFLSVALRALALENGYLIDLFESDYDQVERQCLDLSSDLYEFKADYVIICQSTQKLLANYNQRGLEDQVNLANDRVDFVKTISQSIHSKLVYFNYPEIDDCIFGSFANSVEASFLYQVRSLNHELMDLSRLTPNLFICDLASVQNKIGRDFLFSPSLNATSGMVYSLDAIPLVMSRALDIILALQGRLKKCLILDLDNTLWGGVIGDDGIENIQIGQGRGIGKAFTELQEWARKLKDRGILLAVCSKNTESIAREPFEKHPDMVLKLEDFSVFVANWDNKADNIRRIQQTLNIGFESMVFLDDNPFERNIVRENLPSVTVPELPNDPSNYLEYLYSLNVFETASFSKEDVNRTRLYQVEAQRVSQKNSFTNEDEFLASLNMQSEVKPFDRFTFARVAQLTQRSNQFNLRTKRYSESDIEKLSRDHENYHGLTFTLSDKFGSNGLISVIILNKQDNSTLFIDTWLLSCRVLKRGMENFTINTLVDYAVKNGYSKIVGEYIATAKNEMVSTHYEDLGFTRIASGKNILYELSIETYKERVTYIISEKPL
ncbi:HAD-IIIC family phosphatase [Schleiferiaceae bacterium]|nr:HAD-IIIC family phosphatase [Schleiferiaceae bacterium]